MLIESIFKYVFDNNDFYNLVYPKLREEFFIDIELREIYKKMKICVNEYLSRPSMKDVALLIDTDSELSEEDSKNVLTKLKEVSNIKVTDNFDLMKTETEKWLLHRACELAVLESAKILELNKPKGKMVELMKEAVMMSLTTNLGYEYAIDAEKQYEFYTRTEEVMKTGLVSLDDLLGGGFRRKALYMLVGKTNVGKCVLQSSQILIRNKKTGKKEKIAIGKFFSRFLNK